MASLRPLDAQIAGGGASIGGSVWGTYPGSSATMSERERERDKPVEWQERERSGQSLLFILFLIFIPFSFPCCALFVMSVIKVLVHPL
jgi:hypothetical protein